MVERLGWALGHHRAGRLTTAGTLYRGILADQPDHGDALHFMGVLCQQLGNFDEAVTLLTRAVAVRPDWAEAELSLGNALLALGRGEDAVAAYRRALVLAPDHLGARKNLGVSLLGQGAAAEAEAEFRQVLARDPRRAEAHGDLGAALFHQGRLTAAEACYRQSLALEPGDVRVRNNLGNALLDQGRPAEAEAEFRQVRQLCPDYLEALSNLGVALFAQGQVAEAIECHRQVLAARPDHGAALENLGVALLAQGALAEAEVCCRQVVALRPDHAEAHYGLGNVLVEQGRLAEAEGCFRQALTLRPDHRGAHGNLVYLQMFLPGVGPAGILAAHRHWNQVHAVGFRSHGRRSGGPRRSGQPRLGFVSPDFRSHPVGFFTIRVLEGLRRAGHEVVCYANQPEGPSGGLPAGPEDPLTARFRAAASLWRPVLGWSDDELAARIIADGIGILFDLTGHMEGNRLLVFARRPAPVQVSWAGYMATTGLEAMDYLLADRHQVPDGCEADYCERIVRLPDSFICYEPPAGAPPVTPLPALSRGHVTFGSFNILAKINPGVIGVWSRILLRLPEARLLLKARGLDSAECRRRLEAAFQAHGVLPDRLSFLGRTSQADHLAAIREVDIALDPFPFSGSTTTLECLLMGVPVVTCPGNTFASRHSLGVLTTLGLTETVAGDFDQYVERAAALAADRPRLADWRAGFRRRLLSSPLCDADRFVRHFEAVCAALWAAPPAEDSGR